MVNVKVLQETDEKTYALVFDKGEGVIAGLEDFARRQGFTAGQFTAIGAFNRATLGFFDRERKDYRKIPIAEQVEVLSFLGNIALDDGEPKIHAPVVVGKVDGTAHGGHVLEAFVWPTQEVILVESPRHLRRHTDKDTGLPLITV